MYKFNCPVCQKEFSCTHKGRVYCSLACRSVANTLPKTTRECLHCRRKFAVGPSLSNQLYCSRKCYEAGRRIPIEIRFWEKVKIGGPNDCWLWTAAISGKGYGMIGVPGTRKGWEPAHRVAYELANGPIPKGQQLNHTCDVRSCVNPTHVYPGTPKQNTQDAVERKRMASGERHGMVKLTSAIVLEIRKRFDAGEKNAAALAREYNVQGAQILKIVRRQRWRHL